MSKTHRGLRLLPCALILLVTSPALGVNGNIGFRTEDWNHCLTIPCGQNGFVYVYAVLSGASASGITGVEFGIQQSAPSGFSFAEIPAAGPNIVLGTAMLDPGTGLGGINLNYPACETGQSDPGSTPSGVVLLMRLFVQNNCSTSVNQLTVVARNPPTNQFLRCPLFVLCDGAFSLYCAGSNVMPITCPFPPFNQACSTSTSGLFYLNPNSPVQCRIAVESESWTGIKSLYR